MIAGIEIENRSSDPDHYFLINERQQHQHHYILDSLLISGG